MAKPCESHFKAINKVIWCLKGRIDFGILYSDESDVELPGFSDLDWDGNPDDRRSTSPYAFNIKLGVVSWSIKKQPIVSLSSTKDKYSNATCGEVWLRWILEDVQEKKKGPTHINCDNKMISILHIIACIMLGKNILRYNTTLWDTRLSP